MSLFEFIMVLLSIIIGLGVAEVLTGIAQALLHRRLDLDSWHLILLATIVFVTLVQVWWESWALHAVPSWNFPQLLLLLVSPVFLYVLSHLLFPRIDATTSLRAHYFENHRLLYTVVAVTAASTMLLQPLAFREPILAAQNFSSLLFVGGSLVLATSAKPTVHSAILPLGVVLTAVDIATGLFAIS